METPDITPQMVRGHFEPVWRKLRAYRGVCHPTTPAAVIARRSARLKRRYEQAYADLARWGLHPGDAKVRAFVKFEKAPLADLAAGTPRLIQYRSPKYTAAIARYLMPVEDWLFKLGPDGPTSDTAERVFAKGLNTWQLGERMAATRRWGDATRWVLLDHSRFDAHVHANYIRHGEEPVYRWLVGDGVKPLMRQQVRNIATTHNGLRYTCRGKKMSGEYNTSLGDSLINWALLLSFVGEVDADIVINGDDSVISVHKDDLGRLDFDWFRKNGWTTKTEVVDCLEHVQFCQANPVEIRTGEWRMVRQPVRAWSRMAYSVKNYRGTGWYRYIRAIGEAELACSDGVPIMQALATCYVRHGGSHQALLLEGEPVGYRARLEPCTRPEPKEPTIEARASFARAFGIQPSEQRAYEALLSGWDATEHLEKLAGVGA